MSRSFNGSTSRLDYSGALVSGPPFTVAGWYYCTSDSTENCLFSLADKDATDHVFGLALRGDAAGDPVGVLARDAVAGVIWANTTAGYTTNTWQHAAGVFASATARTVYLNGGSVGSSGTSVSPAGLDRSALGVFADLTPSGPFNGRLAEFGIWNAALTAAEVAALARGTPAWLVRPQNLVACPPLWGSHSPEVDLFSPAVVWTVTNASAGPDHAPAAPLGLGGLPSWWEETASGLIIVRYPPPRQYA